MSKIDAKVYVTRRIPQLGLDIVTDNIRNVGLHEEDSVMERNELLNHLKNLDGILSLLTDPIDSEIMDQNPNLKIIANYAVGYNNIDVPAATDRNILVTNTPGVLTHATSDMAWALLFAVARNIVQSDQYNRNGKFKGWGPMHFIGGDITYRTLGIIGAGRIGEVFALKSIGFQMKVLYTDVFKNDKLEKKLGAQKVELKQLLRQSDFISIHVPLIPETYHIIGKAELELMKKTAYLINTSRGPVIDEKALVKALEKGEIAGAGLDVYENEPELTAGLKDLPNAVLAPHIASATIETRTKMATISAENLVAGLKDESHNINVTF